MGRFDGKVVIVTGSSSGIGAGTALLLAKEGAKVTITGRKATKKSIIEAGGKEDDINVVIADITDAVGREKIVSSTVEKWGQIDILVNNAGGFVRDEAGNGGIAASLDVLQKTMDLNTFSATNMIQLARPYLVKTQGEIVNVCSVAGQPRGRPMFVYYTMAKAALDQLTRGLAVELIAEGVRVNSVSPGAVVTKFCQSAGMSNNEAETLYKTMENAPDALPIRKRAQPEEIANLIVFLADRKLSRYIIEQTIVIDGGEMLVPASQFALKEEKILANISSLSQQYTMIVQQLERERNSASDTF